MKALIFLLSFMSFMGSAFSSERPELKNIETFFEEGAFVVEYGFDKPINSNSVMVDYINQTIQVDIFNGQFPEGKKSVKINEKNIKNVYTYQVSPETLRGRIIYNSIDATQLKGRVEVFSEGSTLRIVVKDSNAQVAKSSVSLPSPRVETKPLSIPPKRLDVVETKKIEISDEMIQEAALLAEKSKDNPLTQEILAKDLSEKSHEAVESVPKKESEIPVFAKQKPVKKAEFDSFNRMFYGLIVLLVMGLGLFFGTKKWLKKKNTETLNTKIKIVSQHYLGPKKSLAIVRVAGEYILVGITDHNISMIKTLSLMEEEIQEMNGNFSQKLKSKTEETDDFEEDFSPDHLDTDDLDEEFSMKGIRDIVKTKLKNMRQI